MSELGMQRGRSRHQAPISTTLPRELRAHHVWCFKVGETAQRPTGPIRYLHIKMRVHGNGRMQSTHVIGIQYTS